MMMRLIVIVLMLTGLGLLGAATVEFFGYNIVAYVFPQAVSPYVVVSTTNFDSLQGQPGRKLDLVIELKNQSPYVVHLVGLTEC